MLLYKVSGSKWSKIAVEFPGMSENDIKNKFYSSLKSIANRMQKSSFFRAKKDLVRFVDMAIIYEELLPCSNDTKITRAKGLKRVRTKSSKAKGLGRKNCQPEVWPISETFENTIFSNPLSQMVWGENEVSGHSNSEIIKTNGYSSNHDTKLSTPHKDIFN
jgi:hypothetical protein